MKTRKLRKFLMLLASALLLVSVTVGATVAYLTDKTEVVTNTFSVGNVALSLDETDVDLYGVKDSETRVTENAYKLIPGHTYTKDPTVHVAAGSEEGYLFVKVVDEIVNIQDDTTIAAQMAANGWTALPAIEGVDVSNIYYHNTKVNAQTEAKDIKVFETFKIKGNVDVAGYAGKTITVQAYMVQADGFADAPAAYKAAPCTWGKDAAQ